jgi:hypothetical protein
VLPHVSRGVAVADANRRPRRTRHHQQPTHRPQRRTWTEDAFAYLTAYAAVSVTVELLIVVIWSVSVCIYLLLP